MNSYFFNFIPVIPCILGACTGGQTGFPNWGIVYFRSVKKNELRKHFLSERKKLSPSDHESWSVQIGQQLTKDLSKDLQWIHVFVPIAAQAEVNTKPMVRELWKSGRQVVTSKIRTADTLTHHLWTPTSVLTPNAWGIPESDGERVAEEQLDAVIIPLLMVDKQGHRVGYGKGFYDRFLAQCRPNIFKIGVGFFPPVSTISDLHTKDVALDCYITQNGRWEFPS
ncbi:MAG: 5-formyltetrahydrofolate cyclo-ligase [Flavobacteriaceae bacterium]